MPSPARPRSALVLASLALAWGAPIVVLGVRGDFPLNDDWAFARAAERLAATGAWIRVPWMYAWGITHVAAGAAALRLSPLASPFETLRVLTLAWAALGGLGAFALARRLGAAPLVAGVCALCLLWNPLFVDLSFTFMSDVSFAALCTASLWALAGAVEGDARRWPLGLALAALAAASRQPGLALFAAAAAAALAPRVAASRRGLAVAGGALGLAGALLWALSRVLPSADPTQPFGITRFLQEFLFGPYAPYFLARHAVAFAFLLGISLLPVAALTRLTRGEVAFAIVGAAAASLALWLLRTPLPLGLNVLHAGGLGPIGVTGREAWQALPPAAWRAITGLGFASAFALAAAFVRRVRAGALAEPRFVLLVGFAALQWLVVALRAPCFDRYALAWLPALAAALAPREAPPARVACALAAALALGAFGVAGTHDSLAFQRARWQLLGRLEAAGVAPERIDGGFEFGGRFLYPSTGRFAVDDEYRLTLEPEAPGYAPFAQAELARWLPPGTARVYVLHRR